MEEVWKNIKGYEGRYKVSNKGRFLSLRYGRKGKYQDRKPRLLKKSINSAGYYVVGLLGKQHFVHRLVADAFIPNPENKPCVDHIDTNTLNNDLANLRWSTIKENVNNPISREKRNQKLWELLKGKFGVDSNKHRKVYQYSLEGKFIKEWGCMSDACRELGINSSSMTKNCQGLQTQAKGYIWKYEYQADVSPALKTFKPVLQINSQGDIVAEFDSVSSAARHFGTSTGRICSCLKGLTNTCKGFKWKYK